MCLILVAWQSHPDYALVVAGNRDEFYARPAAPAHWWQDASHVLAGRDLAEVIGEAGTWMGVAGDGRFAALTNYRAPSEKRTDARSRGELVSGFLRGQDAPANYLGALAGSDGSYNGFNLLASDLNELWWYSNRSASRQPQRLRPGLYGCPTRCSIRRGPRCAAAWARSRRCWRPIPAMPMPAPNPI